MTEHKMITRKEWARPPKVGQIHFGSCECGGWNARLEPENQTPAATLSRLFGDHVKLAERKRQ